MSLNSVNFDLVESNFSDESNNVVDKKGDSRNSSGRATIYRETGLPHCFTLECNYCSGVRLNILKPRFDLQSKTKLLKEESYVTDINSTYYKNKKSPIYVPDVFKDIGRAYLISILDLEGINPLSRLIKSESETIPEAIQKIKSDMNKEKEKKKLPKTKRSSKFKPEFELVTTDK